MRKTYEAPAIEVITFAQEDVLAASGTNLTAGAILGSGTTAKTEDSTAIGNGVTLW